MSTILDKLKQDKERETGGFPERWKPTQAGEQIIAHFVREESFRNDYSSTTRTMILRDGNEVEWSVFLTSVLERKYDSDVPAAGDLVAVEYLGQKQGKKGNTYHDFAYAVEHAAPPAPSPTGPVTLGQMAEAQAPVPPIPAPPAAG